MNEIPETLSVEEMRRMYGSFYESSPKVYLDRKNVPERFWSLLPYAEFWGIADDLMRENLVAQAPSEAQHNLKQVVVAFDSALNEWLAQSEANSPNPSDEYVAFVAMIMAADYV